jgi:hypothetical protein
LPVARRGSSLLRGEIEAMVAFNDAISPLAHGRYAGIARS